MRKSGCKKELQSADERRAKTRVRVQRHYARKKAEATSQQRLLDLVDPEPALAFD